MLKRLIFVTLFLLFSVATLFAQESDAPAELVATGLTALAMALNTGGVFFLVALVNKWKPKLRERAPQWIPVLAMISGPLLNGLAAILTDAVGMEIDFSPVIGAFGGAAAVAFHQVHKQRQKGVPRSRLPA